MKILRIITRLNIGGPAVHAVLLSTKLDPQRFSTCLIVGQPDETEGDLSGLLEGSQARLLRLKTLARSIHPWSDARAFAQLLGMVSTERPQIIHTHMAKSGALGRLAGMLYNRVGKGRRAGQRAVLIHTFHGHVLDGYFPGWLSRVFVAIERWLARRTDVLIAVSHTVRDGLIKKGIGQERQWRIIPLGLDLSTVAQLPFPRGASTVSVGMVGRLVPIKNPSLFLQALARLRQRHEMSVHGVIVGDGPLRQALEREAEQLGLEQIVRFTGWQRDLGRVYEALDVACLTSWNEGTPVSLIEAMAAGRAVVATDVGGVRDLLRDPEEPSAPIPRGGFQVARRGLLVRAGDLDGLTEALRTLSRDGALRRRLGEAARAHAVQAFSHERLLRDLSALYEAQMLKSRRCA
ncbi:MAG: glycosyltransferase [Candidatus Omnitrophica bacterium]|nr:glycosyltransferase [Candidatus Omnitrophota bacterium]